MSVANLENKHILLVEDNVINQILVQHSLSGYSLQLSVAGDGKRAIELLNKNYFDLVLMDLHLPDMSGYEIVKYMRKSLHLDTPVFALTALSMGNEREACIAAGMNGYIAKPFSKKKLEEELNKNDTALNPTNTSANPFIIGNANTTIDLEFLFTVAENDMDYVQLMFKTYIDTIPPIIDKMQAQCDAQQWDELQKTAHYTKSSLSVIKVKQMIEHVVSIEAQCKTKSSLETIPPKIQTLKELFQQSKTLLLQMPLHQPS